LKQLTGSRGDRPRRSGPVALDEPVLRARRRRRSAGQALVEFAIILPVMMLILLGATDFGRAFQVWVTLNQAARVGANFAAQNPTAWGSTPDPIAQSQYQSEVRASAAGVACTLPATIPAPSFPAGTDLGSPARVSLSCSFHLLFPFLSDVVGGSMTIGATAVFPVNTGYTAGGGGCGLTPTSTWSANPPSATPNESVVFTFQGTGVFTAYTWDFGDGHTGSGSSATHSFTNAGTYNVSVTATPDPVCGPPVTSSPKTFLVSPFLTADFTWIPMNPTVAVPVAFTGTASGGTGPYTWAWDFGDSGTANVQSPSHTFATANTFTVALTVTDSASATYTRTYSITVGPKQCQVPSLLHEKPAKALGNWVASGFLGTNLLFDPPAAGWASSKTVSYQSLPASTGPNDTVPCSTSMTVR
jgi:PKD repeat protein